MITVRTYRDLDPKAPAERAFLARVVARNGASVFVDGASPAEVRRKAAEWVAKHLGENQPRVHASTGPRRRRAAQPFQQAGVSR